MSEEQREEQQRLEREEFSRFLERTSEEVRGWPAWKQAILGLPQTRSERSLPETTSDANRRCEQG
jgi:hypothetical protein